MAVLGLWGVPPAPALAASLAFHVLEIVPIGIVGLIVAWREGVLLSGRLIEAPAVEQPAAAVIPVEAGGGEPRL